MEILKRLWSWFDDITGVSVWLVPLMVHPVPRAGKAAWFYVLGSATLFVFMLQVLSGAALASSYVTSSGQAYESLRFISSGSAGRFLRGMHYFGASAMMILVGLHIIRVYLMGAYKYPRQMNWLTGAGLLLFTLLMAFTGQLLRWDQTGVWTAVIAAEQAGRMPLIGNWLGHFILAGDTVGGATLSRFFATHVFYIPGLIYLFLGFHLYLVIHNGISELPKAGRPVDPKTYRRWYHDLLQREGVPFWPDAAWRDALFGLLVIAALAAIAWIYGPPELQTPPDPTIVSASPRPDWYFMWYFALLSLIPKWSEDYVIVLGPLVFGLLITLLPFIAPKGERSPLRRPWSIGFVVLGIMVVGYYGRMGIIAPWSPRLDAPPLPTEVVGTTRGPVADGAKAFYAKGCEFCHTVEGYGGIRGPDLSDAGDRMSAGQMLTRIFSGAENMPSYTGNLTSEQLTNLVAFLQSRHAKAPPKAASRRRSRRRPALGSVHMDQGRVAVPRLFGLHELDKHAACEIWLRKIENPSPSGNRATRKPAGPASAR
jgi:ubiquinol-cytochrome c reductase cytochrome b subunit